jgi:quinol-cytochrome oxidoreductase complex cytochrome b subunit
LGGWVEVECHEAEAKAMTLLAVITLVAGFFLGVYVAMRQSP